MDLLNDIQNIKQIIEPVHYTVNGKKFIQDELTYKDDCDSVEILKKHSVTGFKELFGLPFVDVILILTEKRALAELLCIILKPYEHKSPLTVEDVESMKNSFIIEVFTDFFGLNPYLSVLLQTSIVALDSASPATSSLNTETTANSETPEHSKAPPKP